MLIVFLTQEIVFLAYEKSEKQILLDFPTMKISCNEIKNESEIPGSKI